MNSFQHNNRLYHYRSYQTAIKHILPERKLLLNNIIYTNDPRENKSFMFSAVYNDGNHDIEKRNKYVSDYLRKDCKVLCFSDDNEDKYWGYSYSRMWALYGDNHHGICLGINRTEFINENQEILSNGYLQKINYDSTALVENSDLKRVDYIRLNEIGEKDYLRNEFRKTHIQYLFFTKNKEWKSEEEIRLIYFSDRTDEEFCTIQNSLKRIYVGVDFEDSKMQSLIDLCPDIDLYKLEFKLKTLVPLLVHKAK